MIGVGTPNTVDSPKVRMVSGKSNCVELVSQVPKPRNRNRVASVTMKGITRRTTMKKALIAPMAMPAMSAMANPAGTGRSSARIAMPAISGARNITAPTERSIPPVSSTKVMPSAAIPMKEDCLTMLARLSGIRKAGACSPNHRSTAPKIR